MALLLLPRPVVGGLRPNGMDRYRVGGGAKGILLLLLWAVPASTWAQTTTPPAASSAQAGSSSGSLPVEIDLNKIRQALLKDPPVNFEDVKPRFYVEIYGHQARFWDFVGSFDFRAGPVPRAGMTHREFLDQVTPKNMYFGPPTMGDVAKIAAASAAFIGGNYVLSKLRQALKSAKTEEERARIQAQIDRELAALAGK
jgi:hypothetical protein